ncbi:MAG: G5 domain-containing protein [Eubacteriales bacterium]
MDNENEKKLESEKPRGEVVIENFDEERDSDEKLAERYAEIMNQEDGEEEISEVAERITGERHSRVTTAAPLRIRETAAQTAPSSTSMPVRRRKESEAETPAAPDRTRESQRKTKRAFRGILAAALLLIVLLTAVVVAVNFAYNRQEGPDTPDSDLPPAGSSETEEPEETTDQTADPSPETDSDEPALVSDGEDPAPEMGAGTGSVSEPEPEPEPEPEFTVTLDFYDREDITATVTQMTLAEVYDAVGYTPRESDRPSMAPDAVIAADAYITIDTAEYKTERVTETVPYGSEVIELDTIPRGTTNYLTYGENGEVMRTYTVEYINGVEKSRTLETEETTKWAVNERYELGVGGSFVGADGVTYTYSYRRTVPATCYSIEGLTYLGTMADESVIAVDPENIPLGTKVYVKNDTYDFGVRIASDVGPKVEEWEVDVWLSPGNPQYASFVQAGYHYDMEIYYLD